MFLDNIPPKLLAKTINNLQSVRFDSEININKEAMVEIFRQMSEETKLKKIFFLYSCLYFRKGLSTDSTHLKLPSYYFLWLISGLFLED